MSIILWLERIVTKAENKFKNLKHTKSMDEKPICTEGAETPKMYTEAELVSFGNYVLSERRKKHIEEQHLIDVVGDWDIANWNAQE